MKRKISLLLCLLSFSMASMALIAATSAQPSVNFTWTNPSFKGYDKYYGETITGYLTGTDWNFTLSWMHDYGYQINVSAVRVYFGWGKNYTHRFANPIPVKPDIPYVFNIQNSTPTNSEAPEYWTYQYWVYLQHVNSTTGPLSEPWAMSYVAHDHNFAVLSQDHFECLNLFMKYGSLIPDGTASVTTTYPFVGFPNITAALVNFTQAMMEFQQGSEIYPTGMFNAAKIHLQRGDAYWVAALNSWSSRGTGIEDATLDHQESETNYNNALANSSLVNAYGWLLFGLGWTFIGLGLIVYAARRPKTPAPS